MLKLTDLRKTTRRASSGGRTLHPHFLRDRSLTPRIEKAIAYLETMLGRTRQELDQEVLVQLFGDHKLARCLVACLAASYRHRSRTFIEVLPDTQVQALERAGITNSSDLRLWLFRRANMNFPGFVGGMERAPFLAEAGAALGLQIAQIEELLTLDSPEHAIMTRTGPIPTAGDITARFNYNVMAAILANAPVVHLTLAKAPRDARTTRELCALADVRAELAGRELTLHGQQDALDVWARHGARLVRLLVALLACGLPVRSGEAVVAAPTGEPWHFRLTAENLAYLGLPESEACATFALDTLLECWHAQDTLMADYASTRRAGSGEGWVLRRATEPLILDGAIIPALFTASRGTERAALVPMPHSEAGRSRLAEAATRLPLVALEIGSHLAEQLRTAPPGVFALTYTKRGDMARLPALLGQAVGEAEERYSAKRLEAMFEEAHEAGVLTEAQIAEHLPCDIEDVPAVLARSEAGALAKDYNMYYVEGFGLCSAHILMRARAVVRDAAHLRERTDGAMQAMRVLGKRLREVTGASEGIECLIAYFGAA
jgi:hypothetical protein